MAVITPNYSRYPNASEVQVMLVGANVWPTDATQIEAAQFQAQAAIAGAINEFEMRTGWIPFLADAVSSTRTFDATDGHGNLDLRSGLQTFDGATIRGNAVVLDTNVFTRPPNALAMNQPITQLLFWPSVQGGSPYPQPNVIAVTGRWGRVLEVPADVWQAILQKAAHIVLLATNQEQDVVGWAQDGFSEQEDQVGVIDPKTLNQEWPKSFENAVARWKRVFC